MELRLLLQCYAMSLFVINVMRVSTANSVASVQNKYVRHSLIPARLSQTYANVDGISLLACAALCSIAHYCFGINFHQTSSQCELINGIEYFGEYHSSNDGWRVYSKVKANTIYTPCSTSKDCLDPHARCIFSQDSMQEKICYCQPLFQYNHDKRRCEQVCFNLASTFTKHIGTYITWHDIQHNVATVEDCEQQCRQHGDNCLSFDYQPSDSKCRLNSISRQDASDSGYLLSETGKNLYTKDCDDSLIV